MDPELLPSRESDRSMQNGESNSEVTLRTYAFLTLTYDVRTLKNVRLLEDMRCALINQTLRYN